ncbi:MAG TPA: Lrp/AsnC family transcriptional regulator [Methanofastidiosum sp.]|jgi:DNA-binding Lrp family transcriptional regulator|nr:Lrp/AsnC family transcriptional regulator [Methanofastidiosum sp.]HNZ87128.1 Lrp/AsnC family transcriptional regulator [Methanofastidiosum sp.]HOC77264.1 Lrp/AsnC family transcriptional regulator [Methanofastidiosum sp.]HOG73487.1 Lrp/AsnC family transcriptional regulator [Methanofastidiosum sp.]HPA48750.1 Lrp/AsnC family transcriptional regulator [Methanofastidiosum sp.]
MDDIDIQILSLLEKDSRMKNTEIAKKLSVSEGSIRRRIENLVETGIIKNFTVEISTSFGFISLVLLNTQTQESTYQIVEQIKTIEGVKRVYETTGEWDVVAYVLCNSPKEFNIIIENIRKLKGVNKSTSLTVLNVV